LCFLGIRAAGTYIALFGGFATAFNLMANGSILWTLTYTGVTAQPLLVRALYGLAFAFGGPGFAVPFGLLLAGISVTSGFAKLLPKWIVVLGLALAVTGELSWFVILFPRVVFLLPITRFLGFIWLIAAGFALPSSRQINRERNEALSS
jgi:hypothetical protein